MKFIEKTFTNSENKSVRFEANTFPARAAIRYLTKLTKLVTGILGTSNFNISDLTDATKSLKNINLSSILQSIGDNLDNEDILNLIQEMLSYGKVSFIGKSNKDNVLSYDLSNNEDFDTAFSADNLPLLIDIFAFVLEANYGSIKKKIFSLLGNLSEKLPNSVNK